MSPDVVSRAFTPFFTTKAEVGTGIGLWVTKNILGKQGVPSAGSDVLMPGLNGIQLAIAIRARCPGTRIVLFSGHAATSDLLREADQSGHSFEPLSKAIHPSQLLKALRL